MDQLFAHFKDFFPVIATVGLGVLIRMQRKFNKASGSLAETRFKADECHEELCKREPEYARTLATWKAHRKVF